MATVHGVVFELWGWTTTPAAVIPAQAGDPVRNCAQGRAMTAVAAATAVAGSAQVAVFPSALVANQRPFTHTPVLFDIGGIDAGISRHDVHGC
jgi:hypothetical protein